MSKLFGTVASSGGLTAGAFKLTMDQSVALNWAQRLVYVASRLPANAKQVDVVLLRDMVALAQLRVARDTGLLRSGITGAPEGSVMVFRASAQRAKASGKPGADYARFVEYGTRGGTRGRLVADSGYFKQARTRKSRRTHPGTEAQPFFYSSAAAVLAFWKLRQAQAAAEAIEIGSRGLWRRI